MAYFRCIGSASPASINVTFRVVGAKEDIITIKNSDETIIDTVVFDTDEVSKIVTIPIDRAGELLTFTSSIAKASDGSTDYSKNILIESSTTEVKVMPDKVFYWYGNECEDATGGWTHDGYIEASPIKRTNYIEFSVVSGDYWYEAIGTANQIQAESGLTYKADMNMISINSVEQKIGFNLSATKAGSGLQYYTVGHHILTVAGSDNSLYIVSSMRNHGESHNVRLNAVYAE